MSQGRNYFFDKGTFRKGDHVKLKEAIRRIVAGTRIFIVSSLTIVILLFNVSLYHPGGEMYAVPRLEADTVPELNFLGTALREGAGEKMQDIFPEGFYFTHVLYGLTRVELGLRAAKGSSLYEQALAEARWALARINSDYGKKTFNVDLKPKYGIFFAGWRAWLEGGILLVENPNDRLPVEIATFEQDCKEIAASLESSEIPFLESYPHQSWPVDTVVGVAALRLHDKLFKPTYNQLIGKWLTDCQRYLDPATQLLPHRVNYKTGELVEGARGSSQSLIHRFLVEIDSSWGLKQYLLFREKFVRLFCEILPGTRQFPPGLDGKGDVDSGPLVFGYSPVATVVTIAAAQVNGDYNLTNVTVPAIEPLGVPIATATDKRYAFGLVPVGDAFLVWAKNSSPWIAATSPSSNFPQLAPSWWRVAIHLTGLLLIFLLWLPDILTLYATRKAMPAQGA